MRRSLGRRHDLALLCKRMYRASMIALRTTRRAVSLRERSKGPARADLAPSSRGVKAPPFCAGEVYPRTSTVRLVAGEVRLVEGVVFD